MGIARLVIARSGQVFRATGPAAVRAISGSCVDSVFGIDAICAGAHHAARKSTPAAALS